MTYADRAVYQRRAIIVLLALILVVLVVDDRGGELDAGRIAELGAAAGGVVVALVAALKRAGMHTTDDER